jgi:hypothetical protein
LDPVDAKNGYRGDFVENHVENADVGAVLILFGGWYLLSARRWFTGPVRETQTEQELESIEGSLQ